jgi:hypothetical protein
MTASEYQRFIVPRLTDKLVNLEVVNEWSAFNGAPYIYSPRVDIAVGPFSIEAGGNQMRQYNDILRRPEINTFLKQIYDFHIENIGDERLSENQMPTFDIITSKNQNARCFLALEIENRSSKKHIMGSMVNAASLGRIGIGIAYNEAVKRTFLRILNYMAFLKKVGKNSYDTTNFLILTKDQLIEVTE